MSEPTYTQLTLFGPPQHTAPGAPSAKGRRYYRCGCGWCADALRAESRAYRDQKRGGPPAEPQGRARGRSCYVGGCEHEECAQANRDYQRGYMTLHRLGIPMVDITA